MLKNITESRGCKKINSDALTNHLINSTDQRDLNIAEPHQSHPLLYCFSEIIEEELEQK